MVILSSKELSTFESEGYLLLRNVLDSTKCEAYVSNQVLPALDRCIGLREGDESTYDTPSTRRMATGEGCVPPAGIMLRDPKTGANVLPDGPDWILGNEKLLGILDQLHDDGSGIRSWEWLHPGNLGWIHVRLPCESPPKEYRWHVDGGHFSPHYLTSPEQSVVILPMLRQVQKGGGNTVVLKGSHIEIGRLLVRSGGLHKRVTQDCRDFAKSWSEDLVEEVAPCEAGDVLLLHPHVVHAAGFMTNSDVPLRISFNLGVRWSRQPRASLEDSSSLEVGFAKVTLRSSDL